MHPKATKRLFCVTPFDPPSVTGFLAHHLALDPRQAERLVTQGSVQVGGRRLVDPSSGLRPGQRLTVYLSGGTAPNPDVGDPAELLPSILYEDEDLLALDKPAGLLCQMGPTGGASAEGFVQGRGPTYREMHLLHRLDREASGVLLFCGPYRREVLHGGFSPDGDERGRRVKRDYLALVMGTLPTDQGEIHLRIAKDASDPRRRRALPQAASGGQPACTRWQVVRSLPSGQTLLRLRLLSGRTHQIRVHLAALGYPVLGDSLYGGREAPRLYLHALELRLVHPRSGRWLTIAAPAPEGFG